MRVSAARVEPKLRFPQFSHAGAWTSGKLGTLAGPVVERVGKRDSIPFTITSGEGLISQQEKLGRTIAGKSLKNYYRLQRDDFAFNKSATKLFPEGYIARLQTDADAAVPNSIFTCFRVTAATLDVEYLDFLLQGNLHGDWLRNFITVGARANGALQISDDDLFAMPVPLPAGDESVAEQRKIAACLGSLDAWLEAEDRKLAALRRHKRGLLQQLFPREGRTRPHLRFPEFRDAGEWKGTMLKKFCELKAGDFVKASAIADSPADDLYPCYGGNGLRGYVESFNTEGQRVLIGRQGALCGNVNLFDGRYHATEHALIATHSSDVDTSWLFYALVGLDLNRFATGQAQPGLSVSVLNDVETLVPKNLDEQRRIATCLSTLDARLGAQADRIDALRLHKRGLMQQLFPAPERS